MRRGGRDRCTTRTLGRGQDGTAAGFLHDALLYGSVEDLAAVAARSSSRASPPVTVRVIAAGPEATDVLREPVGDDPLVLVLQQRSLYRSRTPAAITTFRGLSEQAGADRRVRVVGEVDFGATPADRDEWQRYEAVNNVAFAALPLWGLCVFDTQRQPDAVLAGARATHPHLVSTAGRGANPGYVDPATYLTSLTVLDEPLERTTPALAADDVTDFIGLRRRVRSHLSTLDGPEDVIEDHLLAVDGMTSDVIRHGRRPVGLRLWSAPGRRVCTIRDAGAGPSDAFAGYGPAHGNDLSRGGMGLWPARQLCDHVAVRRDGHGADVRLSTSRR